MTLKVVAVRFQGSDNTYCYKTDLPLKRGQVVLVKSSNGLGITKVVNDNVTNKHEINMATAWVLTILDIREYQDRIQCVIDEDNLNKAHE